MASLTLEVVLAMVDKASGPINAIVEKQSGLNKQINEVKRAMGDNSGAQRMIADYQKIEAQVQKTANSIALDMAKAQEKIAKLDERKSKSKTGTLGARDAKDYEQQQTKVAQLRDKLSQANKTLEEHKDKLKGVGINSNDLSGSIQKLTSEQDKNRASLERLVKQADRYQNGTIFSKLNSALSIKGLASDIGNVAAPAIGLFAGVFAAVKDSADMMDKLDETSQKMNLPIENLQALRYQAQLAGVEAQTMDSAFMTLTGNLGKLQATGDGKLASYLKASGDGKLFRSLKGAKNSEQAYDLMLDAINKQKNTQKQLALAKAAFGDNANEMLPLIGEGKKGRIEAGQELKQMGGMVDANAAKNAGAFNDALDKLIISFNGIKASIITPVMIELTAAMEDLLELVKNADWREAKIKELGDIFSGLWVRVKELGAAFSWIIDHYQELIAGFLAVKIALFALNAVMLANPIGIIVAAFAGLALGIVYLLSKLDLLQPALDGLWQFMKRFFAAVMVMVSPFIHLILGLGQAVAAVGESLGLQIGKDASDSLAKLQKELAEFTNGQLEYAVNGDDRERVKMIQEQEAIFKSPQAQSKSEVSVRILSDQPTVIEKAQSDGKTDLNVDAGMLLGNVF